MFKSCESLKWHQLVLGFSVVECLNLVNVTLSIKNSQIHKVEPICHILCCFDSVLIGFEMCLNQVKLTTVVV